MRLKLSQPLKSVLSLSHVGWWLWTQQVDYICCVQSFGHPWFSPFSLILCSHWLCLQSISRIWPPVITLIQAVILFVCILYKLFSEEALLHSEPSSDSLWAQSKSQFYRPLFSLIPHLLPPFLDTFSFSLPLSLQQLLQPFLSANKPQASAVSISSSWITVSRLQD